MQSSTGNSEYALLLPLWEPLSNYTTLVLRVGQGHTLRLESSDFGRHDQKDLRVGASALVMFQSLIVSGGERRISCSLLVLGTGYDTEWEWQAFLTLG